MATHTSILAREFYGQRSLVGCCPQGRTESDMTEATQHACMHWRKKWQPTPIFLPGESQIQRHLVGCRLWDHTESDTTEATQQQQQQQLFHYMMMSVNILFQGPSLLIFRIMQTNTQALSSSKYLIYTHKFSYHLFSSVVFSIFLLEARDSYQN